MNPDLLLCVLATLADYLLKTTFAFGLCFIAGRLVTSPSRRLAVWFSFLFGAAGYWLWLAEHVFNAGPAAATAAQGVLQPAASPLGVWTLRSSWAAPLGITVRMAAFVYLAVLVWLFCSHLKKWWHLQWVLKFTTSAPPIVSARFKSLADSLGVGRSRLLLLSGVTSPATFGWIRPTVLLPDVCLQQDEPDLDDILLHELHHVRRWDFVWNRLAMVCRALLFFHPACWYAVRRLNLERELACDLAVVTQTPERRATYAECLIRFARLHASQSQDQKAWGIDFAAAHHLKARVRSILAGSEKLPVWSVCLRTACAATLLTSFLGVVPSIAVLLSFAQQQRAEPLKLDVVALQPGIATKAKTVRKISWNLAPIAKQTGSSGVSPSPIEPNQSPLPILDRSDSVMENTSARLDSAGPRLLHRSLSAGEAKNATKQQTSTLLDPGATAQSSKVTDRKQALEQTATTAMGIYRRLGAVDRH